MSVLSVLRPLAAGLALLLGLSLVAASPASARDREDSRRVVTITHAPLTATSVTGTGLGTVRTYLVPTTTTGRNPQAGYMTGTLVTTAQGLPGNQEARVATLVFVVGSEPNQLVIGGLSLYPSDGSTIAAGTSTVRPIIGGSGIYSGARGSVESTNLGEQGWRHVFRMAR